jgi:DNA-binding Xre family transcriptional regulator
LEVFILSWTQAKPGVEISPEAALRLKCAWEKTGLTNRLLSERAGVPNSIMSGLLSGRYKKIGEQNLEKLCAALNCSKEFILFGEGN